MDKERKARLREIAITNNFGGDNFKDLRRYYSDDEIYKLFEQYKENKNKLKSLFSDKIFTRLSSWKNDISKYIDIGSRNRFYFAFELANDRHKVCYYCKIPLDISRFHYHTGFLKYCKECNDNRVFTSTAGGIKDLKRAGNAISIAKKNFFNSERGKIVKRIVGDKNSFLMKEYFKTEKGLAQIEKNKKHQSAIIRKKIANGEFIPCISNSWTHWKAVIIIDNRSHRFRSSWEACFFLSNPHLEYEKFRIPYVDENNVSRTYIADFFDRDKNILFEIKPKSTYLKQRKKMSSVIEFCLTQKIKFIWVNEFNILDYVKESDFTNKDNMEQYLKMLRNVNYAKAKD